MTITLICLTALACAAIAASAYVWGKHIEAKSLKDQEIARQMPNMVREHEVARFRERQDDQYRANLDAMRGLYERRSERAPGLRVVEPPQEGA